MKNYFPYEKKMIEDAMKLIPRDKVQEYCEITTKEAQKFNVINYLVVYSKSSRKFFGIPANRFIKNNYASAIMISCYGDIYNCVRRCIKAYRLSPSVLETFNVQLFGYDDYKQDYKDNGYELFETLYPGDTIRKIGYAITYQQHPKIKNIAQAGYYKLVDDILNNLLMFDVDMLLNKNIDDWKIDEASREFLNRYNRRYDEWIYVHKLNSIDKITFEQLQYIHTNNIEISEIYELVKHDPQYTVESLIEYINRCILYQGYNPRRVTHHLLYYLKDAAYCGIKADYFPRDLQRSSKYINALHTNYSTATRKTKWANYPYNYKKRNRYYYADEDYYIKPENDLDALRNYGNLFVFDIEYTNNVADYFWLCDKKTKKEIALIKDNGTEFIKRRIRSKVVKYNEVPITRKEAMFVKKWFTFKNNLDLALVQS